MGARGSAKFMVSDPASVDVYHHVLSLLVPDRLEIINFLGKIVTDVNTLVGH